MARSPTLLRRRGRRGFRRLVYLCALAGMLLTAPGASGLPNDTTPPVITVKIFGTLGTDDGKAATDGWFVSNVIVNWKVEDPESPILSWSGCEPQTLDTDTLEKTLTCSATSDGGGPVSVTKRFTIDKTPPAVSPAPSRQPDSNGWYSQGLTVSFSATDALSGVASCSTAAYAGPDNPSAAVPGSCRDNAGNVGSGTFSFKYDATAPAVSNVRAILRKRSAQLSWSASADTRVLEVRRTPGRKSEAETLIFRGSAAGLRDSGLTVGRRYHYRVTGFDEAANSANQSVVVTAAGALFSPAPGAKVGSPPKLMWTTVKRARYYNLQVIRGRKVLSAWPVSPGFQLRRTWTYNGRRYRLQPGVYRWYVWPGIGRRSAARYGRLLGSSTFVVSR